MKDEFFMKMALRLASEGKGRVFPNPLVGAVLVREDEVVGRGYHPFFGGPHAEVLAIEDAGTKALGAALYCNLEPCVHQGKQPPCVPRIIGAGIKKVVIAMVDPYPLNRGKGAEALRKAGIEVIFGPGEKKARLLNERFIRQCGRDEECLRES